MTETNILLVDDEIIIRSALQRNLKKSGYNTDTCANAVEALALLESKEYKILITDYLMEGLNGIELSRKAKEINDKIKVILFSGYANIDFSSESISKDTDAFLHKPLSLDELLGTIEQLIEK